MYAKLIARYIVQEQLLFARGAVQICCLRRVMRDFWSRQNAHNRLPTTSEFPVRAVEPYARRDAPPSDLTKADWKPLSLVLESYSSTVSKTTCFTPYRLAFGREMRLPGDLNTPLPEPPREVRTFAAALAEDLEWS